MRIRPLPFLLVCMTLASACAGDDPAVSGVVEPQRVNVSAEMSARLTTLHATEGARVDAGAVLAELDCAVPTAERQRAQAALDAARAERDLVREGARTQDIAAAEARLEAAQQQLAAAEHGATREQRAQIEAARDGVDARIVHAEQTVERLDALSGSGAAAVAELDAARAERAALQAERERLTAQLAEARRGARSEERAVLEAGVEQAQQALDALREGARSQELDAAEARVAQAEAALALADVSVGRCTITAPVAGTVDIVDYEPGELVPAGRPVIALALDTAPRVRTWATQQWLGDLHVGSTLDVRIDGDERVLQGTVERLHDEPSFTAGNVQTPDDRMLLVYRVDLVLDVPDDVTVRGGMTVTVTPP